MKSVECFRCNGEGWIVDCLDDLCHATGECIHGDGNVICPACEGEGELYPECPACGSRDVDDEAEYCFSCGWNIKNKLSQSVEQLQKKGRKESA